MSSVTCKIVLHLLIPSITEALYHLPVEYDSGKDGATGSASATNPMLQLGLMPSSCRWLGHCEVKSETAAHSKTSSRWSNCCSSDYIVQSVCILQPASLSIITPLLLSHLHFHGAPLVLCFLACL